MVLDTAGLADYSSDVYLGNKLPLLRDYAGRLRRPKFRTLHTFNPPLLDRVEQNCLMGTCGSVVYPTADHHANETEMEFWRFPTQFRPAQSTSSSTVFEWAFDDYFFHETDDLFVPWRTVDG